MNQKIKTLATKIISLRSELKVSKDLANAASQEVDEMFKKDMGIEHAKKETEIVKQTKPKTKELKQNPPSDLDSKKAFRKIALKTHPDKLIGLDDESELKRKTELYQKAQKAMDDQDLLILADISIDLGIKPPEITNNHIKKTIDEINSIKKEINHIESTYVWKWLFCLDKQQKEQLLKKMFEIMQRKYETENPRP